MGQAPHRPQAGLRSFPRSFAAAPRLFLPLFTAGRATGVQAGLGAAPGRARGRASLRCPAVRRGLEPRVPGTVRPGTARAPFDGRQLFSGTSHRRVPFGVLFFSRGGPLLKDPYWARRMFWGAERPAALPGSGLSIAGVPAVGEESGAASFNFGVARCSAVPAPSSISSRSPALGAERSRRTARLRPRLPRLCSPAHRELSPAHRPCLARSPLQSLLLVAGVIASRLICRQSAITAGMFISREMQ